MQKSINFKTYFFSYFVALLFVLIAYAVNGIYPFGDYSVLTADLKSQYIDVTVAFFEQLKNGENIFVSWRSGLGSNLYAVALYVMANPLSVLFAFADVKYYQEVYLIILMLKISFVSLCFSVYAANSRLLRLTDIKWNVVFSLCYALCVFTLKATINPMWLENIALLPIVFLGIEKIIENKKPALYFVAIAGCFITNYYLSYMTGIFTVVYLIYYFVLFGNVKEKLLPAVTMFFVFTVLAIGLSMFVVYPSFRAVSGTYTDVVGVGYEAGLVKFSVKDIAFAFVHNISNWAASGYPNAYFGIFALWLSLAYFINGNIPKKQRLTSAVIMLFFVMGLFVNVLYYAWHLFRAPTGFDGRFLYGVVLYALIMAIQGFKCFDGVNKKHFFIIGILLLLCANYSVLGRINSYYIVSIMSILALVIIYGILIIRGKREKLLLSFAVLELLVTVCNGVRIIKLWDMYAPHNEYITYVTEYKDNFNALKQYDDSFYRSDCDKIRSYNSPLSVGYNAINHFSSLANQKTFDTMKKMGVTTLTDNKVLITFGQNIVLDSLFNIKYFGVMDKSEQVVDNLGRSFYYNGYRVTNSEYQPVFENGKSVFYQNNKVFPLMFAVDETAKTVDFVNDNPFENQTRLFSSLFENFKDQLYEEHHIENADLANCEVKIDDDKLINVHLTNLSEDKVLADSDDEIGIVRFEYQVPEDGNYFTVLNGSFAENASVNMQCYFDLNGVPLPMFRMENELKDLGWYKKGDVITLTYHSFIDTSFYWPEIYRLDNDAFNAASTLANENGLAEIKNIDGDITAVSDFNEEQLIFSSIAYDEGVKVFVDGNEVEKQNLAQGFLGFYVPEGEHKIKISYVSAGNETGMLITIVSLILSVIAIALCNIKKCV